MHRFLLATFIMLLLSLPAFANYMVYGSLLSTQMPLKRQVGFSMLSRINDFLLKHNLLLFVTDIRDGIYSSELDDYQNNKDTYDINYYEDLLVLYQRKGLEGVRAGIAYRIDELVTDKVLIDSWLTDVEQIEAVLIWNHRDYGKSAVIGRKADAQLIRAEEAQDVSADARLYGEVAGVFSDGRLAIRVSAAISAEENQHWEFSPDRIYVVERGKVKIK